MAQDLLTISVQAFELQLFKMSNGKLKEIIKMIYNAKWEKGKDFSDAQIMELERKETKILAEMQRRGYFKKADNQDYFDWIKTINKKRRQW